MTILSSDSARLLLDGEAVAGIRRRTLTLQRQLGDRTHANSDGWIEQESLGNPSRAELRVQGVFVSSIAMNNVRASYLAGDANVWSMQLPGEGLWSGKFIVAMLEFTGKAEDEMAFSMRLSSTGPITFTEENAG